MTAMIAAYRADMVALRERGWFTKRTRSIIVSFALYNPRSDLWLQNEYILEMPVSAIVVPKSHVDVYRPSTRQAQNFGTVLWLDITRLVFALYIFVFQICYEVIVARRRKESLCLGYLLSPLGFADLGIGLATIVIFIVRHVVLATSETSIDFATKLMSEDVGYRSTSDRAWLYRLQIQFEGPLLAVVLFRLLSFLRINRQVYIIWTTLVEVSKRCAPFLLSIAPLLLGFVLWAHAIWGGFAKNFASVTSSCVSVVMMVHGDIDMYSLIHSQRPSSLAFGVCLYGVVWLIVVNGWIAVIVHVYEGVRIRVGWRPSDYKWKEKHYVNWMLWTPFQRLYFNVLRPRIERPMKFIKPVDDSGDADVLHA